MKTLADAAIQPQEGACRRNGRNTALAFFSGAARLPTFPKMYVDLVGFMCQAANISISVDVVETALRFPQFAAFLKAILGFMPRGGVDR